MKVHWCVIVLAIFYVGCDTKSVGCDGSKNCGNGAGNNTEAAENDELEELKENVGKIGNKLEGIVYEVLKDLLRDDQHKNETDLSNLLIKEKEKPSNQYISSVTENEIAHSNKSSNGTLQSSGTKKQNFTSPSSLNFQQLATNLPDPTNQTNSSMTEKPRTRRMIHENPDQTRSVESFLESNQDKNTNMLEDPAFVIDPVIENGVRLRSKEDPVRREPKREPTEDNKSKKPQDDTNLRRLDDPMMARSNVRHLEDVSFTSNGPTSDHDVRSRSKEDPVRREPKREPTEDNKSKKPQDDTNLGHFSSAEDAMTRRFSEDHFISDIQVPEHDVRLRSKDDPVRREPKREPTEDNKSKKPQDDTNLEHFLSPNEPSLRRNTNIRIQETIDSQKRHKSPTDTQRYPRRKIAPTEDYHNEDNKKITRTNDETLDQRTITDEKSGFQIQINNSPHFDRSTGRKSSSEISIEDISDQKPRATKKLNQKDGKILRSTLNQQGPTHMEMRKMPTNEEMIKQRTNYQQVEDGDVRVGQSYMWANQPSNCFEKNNRDDMLEKQHIEDLKYEVSKLRSVVDLLKEQQKLINSFDGDKKTMNTQEMMSVLNQLNSNNEKSTKMDKTIQYPVDTPAIAKHEELGQIKVQLKEAIANLNRTKEILNLEHQKEMSLETELKSQKTEINWLKLVIENFILAQAKKKLKEETNVIKTDDAEMKTINGTSLVGSKNPLLGSKKSHNRTIPSTVKVAEEKLMELEEMKSRESSIGDDNDRDITRRMKNMKVSSPKSRASSLSNLEKLLDNLNDKQSKTLDDDDSFQLRLLDAMKQLRKKKEEESFTKDLLRKLDLNTAESKSEDDMLVKFQKALKALDNPQGKSDDTDIEDQLKVLQREINKLKANDDVNIFSGAPAEDNTQLQLMLTKLIANNPQFQGGKVVPPISPQQLMQLQKKLIKPPGMVPSGLVPPVMANSVGGDFGVTPPASLMNALPSGISKLGPFYGSFGPNLGPFSPNQYGKDLDVQSLNSYPTGYGLGSDLSKIMSYGGTPANSFSSNNGYMASNDYGFYGNNGYPGNNGYLNGGQGTSSVYPGHSNSYSSLGIYGSSKMPYSGMSSYGNMFGSSYKNTYGKTQDGYRMNPYTGQPLSYSNPAYGQKLDQYGGDKQGYGNSNFFQINQPTPYGSGPPTPYLPPKAVDASSPDKVYGNQQSYAAPNPPYASDKIEELKTQIYSLQNAISTYNRPEYTPTAEDRNTIHNLEQQIEELKGIVNSLNGHSGEQQNYAPPVSQYEPTMYNSPNDPKNDNYNRESEKKFKRSIQEEKVPETKTHSYKWDDHSSNHTVEKLWDKITSFLDDAYSGMFEKHGNKTRRKRSVDDNTVEDNASSKVMDKLTTVLREVLDDEPDSQSKSLYGPTNSMSSLSRSAENQQGNIVPKQASLQDIKNQIDHLKKQLGSPKEQTEAAGKVRTAEIPTLPAHTSARHAILPEPSYGFNYALNQFSPDLSIKPKKLDIFKEIVAKVMDKVIESLPVILQKLFGFAVHELTAYGDDYGAAYGGDNSYLAVFRNLGIFGYLPLILLRIVNAISTFIYILQKNKFLKYFLVPAGVVLLVAGGMVFLIWWMQPTDYYMNYDKLSYDKDTTYNNDYYQGEYGKNGGQIVKSYEDGKSRLHSYNTGGDSKALQNTGYPAFYKPNLVVPSDNQLPSYNE